MEILNSDGTWKEEVIKDSFLPCDVETILNMPKRNMTTEDEIIWGKDLKGIFTVKSAYHLATFKDSQLSASISDLSVSKRPWKSIWQLNSRPKVKIHLWKATRDALPTLDNIKKKGLITNERCFLCRSRDEDVEHIFWNCKVVRKIWGSLFPNLNQVFLICRGW